MLRILRRAILIAGGGSMVGWMGACSLNSSLYQFAKYPLVPSSSREEFTVGAFVHTGSDILESESLEPSSALKLESRNMVSVGGWWHIASTKEGKGTLAIGVQFMHNRALATSISKPLWSQGSAVWVEALMPATSPDKPIFIEAGTYMGFFAEAGSFVREADSQPVIWGLLWGVSGGARFKSVKGNEFVLRYNLGAPGGFSCAYRVGSLTLLWSTHILGTLNSPYPVVTAGMTFSF